jgi:hypothetical protein
MTFVVVGGGLTMIVTCIYRTVAMSLDGSIASSKMLCVHMRLGSKKFLPMLLFLLQLSVVQSIFSYSILSLLTLLEPHH